MAPLTLRSFDLSAYLESLTLKQREALSNPFADLSKRSEDGYTQDSWNLPRDSSTDQRLGTRTFELRTRDAPLLTGTPNHAGAVDPSDINMKGVQAVIAIICCSMVLAIIWFFFWARNGGFQWRKGDWDEYKSTVLRRKGPNGTTLSNATKSTILGGGSVVGEGYSDRDTNTYADETSTVYTGTMTELSSSTAPIVKEKQREYTGDGRAHKKSRRREENAKERKQRAMKEAEFEGGHDADVRAYMKERPARVGGMNVAGDTLHYGTDYTDTESSVGNTAHQPRKASLHYTTATTSAPSQYSARQPPREARPPRRDFSYTIGGQQEQDQFTVRSESPPPVRVPARASVQQSNTMSYHHPLPALRGGYPDNAGGRQGGFRRGVGDDFDD